MCHSKLHSATVSFLGEGYVFTIWRLPLPSLIFSFSQFFSSCHGDCRSISYPTGKFDTRAIRDEIFSLLVPQVPVQPQASSSALDILREKFPTINLAKEDAGKLLELLNGGTQCESFGQTQDPTDV
ncbi:hypothetical protein DUNSADRAFT_4143 [Dunaliella salina]|uniref:Encoded protein n=1 Tax=Dunaliella salina TaxID=3046 RepID=A0ABQ7FUX9_DUNSA|nr:hypothetical protein DUNSADRAFT_4143 [Dunaliella salina]|eukprot:KAF5826206.1 hypothetical protein DUNSADRAFT_4143 [Dunaliella salina]